MLKIYFNHFRFNPKYEIIGDFDFFIKKVKTYKTIIDQ